MPSPYDGLKPWAKGNLSSKLLSQLFGSHRHKSDKNTNSANFQLLSWGDLCPFSSGVSMVEGTHIPDCPPI
jgi:hypothetical protein